MNFIKIGRDFFKGFSYKVHVDVEKLEPKCRDYLDHEISWGGDGYYCGKCMTRFVPDETQAFPAPPPK